MKYRPLSMLLVAFVLFHIGGFLGSSRLSSQFHLSRSIEIWVNGQTAASVLGFTNRVQVELPAAEVEKVESLKVVIGEREWQFDRSEVKAQWKVEPVEREDGVPRVNLIAPPEVELPRSKLTMLSAIVNWGGDDELLAAYRPWLIVSGVFLAMAWLLCRRAQRNPRLQQAIRRALGLEAVPDAELVAQRSWPWMLGGFLVMLVAFARLEGLESYYFMQDDNLVETHPMGSYGWQAIRSGYRPEWNPYQFSGAPVLSLGFFGLTYPVLWLSWAIAQYGLGDIHRTFDVFALLHMAAGYFLNYLLARRLGMTPALAMAGALSIVLSGCTLILGRSWVTAGTPWLVWLPLLMLSILWLQRRPVGWRWAALTGLTIGLWYQVGFTPMWLYGLAFYGLVLGLLLIGKEVPWNRVPWVGVAGIHGLALSLPLLYVMLDVTGPIQRSGNYGNGVAQGTLTMMLPYPLATARHPNQWGSFHTESIGEFYYWGTLFPAAFFLAAMLLLVVRNEGVRPGPNVWLIAGMVAFVLTLGHAGFLWTVLSKVPVFGPINNHPFRVMPELLFFGMLGGGLFLQRFSTAWPGGRRWIQGLSVAVAALLLYHVQHCQASFYSYAERPYPPLPAAMRTLMDPEVSLDSALPPARVLSLVRERSAADGYMKALKQCMPTVYRIPSIDGYNPLIESTPPMIDVREQLLKDPFRTCEALGVRWILMGEMLPEPSWPSGTYNHDFGGTIARTRILKYPTSMTESMRAASKLRLELDGLEVLELPPPDALAFWQSQPKRGLPLRWTPEQIEVATTEPPGARDKLVVNVLWRKQWHAYAGEQQLPVEADPWHRMVVTVPPEASQVTLRFEPPWQRALFLGGLIEGVAIGASIALSWIDRRRDPASSLDAGL
ncbi:MAG: hypothetical protein K2R98_01695 [Gemmataceae bacterium]|nr:hypothetical protein [Gemmataceae bacterium]